MQKIKAVWQDFFQNDREGNHWWLRRKELCRRQDTEIVRIQGDGQIFRHIRYDNKTYYHYLLHLVFLMKQREQFRVEEHATIYQFRMLDGEIREHKKWQPDPLSVPRTAMTLDRVERGKTEQRFTYDRHAAVQYAERWWNSYNPDYKVFEVDCTNYISQCLRAGGAPMHGMPVRDQGWWYSSDNWSFSWSVAHSLRWYLSGSTQGLKGKAVENPESLIPGDVICYDFSGDGRWDHNTIVVAKDADGMPLVNAHTDNSRNRYWSYEDSTAWTPNIQYKFFRIGEE